MDILGLYHYLLENAYYILVFLWIVAIIVYFLKLVIPAWDKFTRFGKNEITQVNFFSIDNKIGWILFYSFSCIMFFVSFILKYPPGLANYLIFMHSFRRLNESLFITKFSPRKMHIINLAAGLLFYVMVPMTLAVSYKPVKHPFIIIISAIALNIMQFICHLTLSKLKKYSIPKGFLFEYSASPHYFIEVILYFLYAITAPSFITLLMVIFVAFNLTHNAFLSYSWYENKFGDEFISLDRYVIAPFIF